MGQRKTLPKIKHIFLLISSEIKKYHFFLHRRLKTSDLWYESTVFFFYVQKYKSTNVQKYKKTKYRKNIHKKNLGSEIVFINDNYVILM